MHGFLQPLVALEPFAEARKLLEEAGKPADVYRQASQCMLEEVIFYGVPAGGHTSCASYHDGDDAHSGLFDRITA